MKIELDASEIAAKLNDSECIDALGKAVASTKIQEVIKSHIKTLKVNIPQAAIDDITKSIKDELPSSSGSMSCGNIEDMAKQLVAVLDAQIKAGAPAAKSAKAGVIAKGAPAASGKISQALFKHSTPGLRKKQGKQFLKLKGSKGTSKTYQARKFGENAGFDLVVEVACMSDMEAKDFIGGPTVSGDGSGGFLFVDGPLATAWKAAADGKPVLVILDEIGNVPRKQQQAFLTCTSPYIGADGEEWLKLPTGRPLTTGKDKEGNTQGTLEELHCPMANISIVGTQNVGPKYDCEPDTPAIKARFKPIPVKTDADLIKTVLSPRLKEAGIGAPANLVTRFTKLWRTAEDAVKKSLLDEAPSIREFLHAIDLMQGEGFTTARSCADAHTMLKDHMTEEGFCAWFSAEGHDGEPMQDQMETWVKLVNKVFS